jgi:hypothetical protein
VCETVYTYYFYVLLAINRYWLVAACSVLAVLLVRLARGPASSAGLEIGRGVLSLLAAVLILVPLALKFEERVFRSTATTFMKLEGCGMITIG